MERSHLDPKQRPDPTVAALSHHVVGLGNLGNPAARQLDQKQLGGETRSFDTPHTDKDGIALRWHVYVVRRARE